MTHAADERPECDAYADGPEGGPRCEAAADFVIDRVADSPLCVCSKHLGPVLLHGRNVRWPPQLEWLGNGDAPPNAVLPAAAKVREDRLWQEISGDQA